MNRIMGFIIFISMITGCFNNSIPKLSSISRYTEQELEERLLGHSQDEIISQWKEPDGMCFGMWCDIWNVNEMNIFVYYGEDGKVEKILLDEIQDPDIDEDMEYSECISGNVISINKELLDDSSIEIMGYEDRKILINKSTEYYRYDAKTTETISATKQEININDYVEIEITGKHYGNEYHAKSITVIENKDYLKDGTYLEVMENMITGIGRGSLQPSYEIEEKDSKFITELLKEGNWIEDTTKCESNYAFNLKGRLFYYHSECGTFNLYDLSDLSYISSQNKEIDGVSVKLDEENKVIINKIINNYIK